MKNYYRYLIVLTVVLAILKLSVWEALSWWWVFAPMYAPIAFVILVLIVSMLIVLVVGNKSEDEQKK